EPAAPLPPRLGKPAPRMLADVATAISVAARGWISCTSERYTPALCPLKRHPLSSSEEKGCRSKQQRQLLIVTVTPAEVVRWPATSRAVAVSVYVPFARPCESHVSGNFAGVAAVDTSAPIGWPLSANCTPPNAWSSTAVATRVTVPVSVLEPARPGDHRDTTGGASARNTVLVITNIGPMSVFGLPLPLHFQNPP